MPIAKLTHLFAPKTQLLENESEVILAVKNNDQQVIKELYYKNKFKVYKAVESFKNSNLDADDIYQDGFSIAVFNVMEEKFKAESSFSTYLVAICRNICLRQLSKQKPLQLTELHDFEEELQDCEMLNELISLKQQLGLKCKEIIDLRFSFGDVVHSESPNKCLSFDEIAEMLQITPVSARQRFKRCLDKLKEMVISSSRLKNNLSL